MHKFFHPNWQQPQAACPYTPALMDKIREKAVDNQDVQNVLDQMEEYRATKGAYPFCIEKADKSFVSTTSSEYLLIGLNPDSKYSMIEAVKLTISSISQYFDTNAVDFEQKKRSVFEHMQQNRPHQNTVMKTVGNRPRTKPYRA